MISNGEVMGKILQSLVVSSDVGFGAFPTHPTAGGAIIRLSLRVRRGEFSRRMQEENGKTTGRRGDGASTYGNDFSRLGAEEQNRLILIGYNLGWENLKKNIDDNTFWGVIEDSGYDNQTLDEYNRWAQVR